MRSVQSKCVWKRILCTWAIIFSYHAIGSQGNVPVFDEYGSVYWILPIWSSEYLPTAEDGVMILFDYNVNDVKFEIDGVMYMSDYVTVTDVDAGNGE